MDEGKVTIEDRLAVLDLAVSLLITDLVSRQPSIARAQAARIDELAQRVQPPEGADLLRSLAAALRGEKGPADPPVATGDRPRP